MEAIKQLASVVRKQIASAKARVGTHALGAASSAYLPWMEGGNIPSRNEQFYYVARPDGLVQIQQDAAFVVEHIFVTPRLSVATELVTVRVLGVSIVDANSGRKFTDGTTPSVDVELTAQRTVQFNQTVPIMSMVPIGVSSTAAGLWQWDAWFALDTELMLPRGGSVRAITTVQTNSEIDTYEMQSYVLAGYKVFG